ncbi:MAG: ATP-binding cassette domain-containing protein [Rhodovulum sp.]|nr:ATP-binding cassette domain-containing protein [Rhodovulum sp.]
MKSIRLRNVSKSYGATPVLSGINLQIEPGEFIVLLGPSGCGKSTLLNIIAGLEDPSGGQLLIGDRDVTTAEPADRGLAMVFQSYALFPTMRVRDNLTFGLRIDRTPRAEIEKRLKWVSELLQIEGLLDRKPGQLSGGQRQRVAIGRALIRSTDVCLFDEPLSNLDAKLRTETRVEIKKLHRDLGTTIVYVTHDQVEAMTMADRVAVLSGGKVEQYDTPQAIYDKPMTRFVAGFLGSPSMNFLSGTVVAENGLRLVRDGGDLDLSGYDVANGTPAGEAELGIRPEALRLTAPEAGRLRARVESIDLMGADRILWMSVDGRLWSVRVERDRACREGEEIGLDFSATAASLFSRDTGARF